MGRIKKNNPRKGTAPEPVPAKPKQRKALRLPIFLLFVLALWAWTTFYYRSIFEVSREYSFWSTDSRLLTYFMSQPNAWIRYVGRMLLTAFHYPWLGSTLLTLLLAGGTYLFDYVLRALSHRDEPQPSSLPLSLLCGVLPYLPALAYLAVLTELGLDSFYESETGYIMAVPLLYLVGMLLLALLVGLSTRHPLPSLWRAAKADTTVGNWLQAIVLLLSFAAIVGYNECQRPYVRTICRMIVCHNHQDWEGVQRVARANAEQSNRIMATYYAIALVHTDQIGSRVYDIRLEYDTLRLHGMDGRVNNGINMYLQEGDYHAGLSQTSYHACMEEMVMTGPSLRLLKLMTKCALMRSEWELARKYLRILSDVPFEGDFCRYYTSLVGSYDLVSTDPEMKKLRELEPIEDSFENQHQNPTFMGYNLNLGVARSMAAWNNSVAVCLYTKLLPQFTARLQPYVGNSLPDNFADGAILASRKYPEIMDAFPSLKWRASQLNDYTSKMQPYMSDRPKYGPTLFPEQKGYYPHYYFFGNLRATKAGYTGEEPTRNAGVN